MDFLLQTAGSDCFAHDIDGVSRCGVSAAYFLPDLGVQLCEGHAALASDGMPPETWKRYPPETARFLSEYLDSPPDVRLALRGILTSFLIVPPEAFPHSLASVLTVSCPPCPETTHPPSALALPPILVATATLSGYFLIFG